MNAPDIPFIMLGVMVGIFGCVCFYFYPQPHYPDVRFYHTIIIIITNKDKMGVKIPKVENKKKIKQNNNLI